MSVNTIVRTHIPGHPDRLQVMTEVAAKHCFAMVDSMSADGDSGVWLAVPPAGSEWEALEWEAAARRASGCW